MREDILEPTVEGETQNGQYHDDQIENVPRLSEVVEAQSDKFEKAFGGEGRDENVVHDVEERVELVRRSEVFHRHDEGVEDDEDRDGDVEISVGHDAEDESGEFEARPRNGF